MPNCKTNTSNMPILEIIAIIGESIIASITMLILIPKNVFGMIDKNYIRYTFSMSWLTIQM